MCKWTFCLEATHLVISKNKMCRLFKKKWFALIVLFFLQDPCWLWIWHTSFILCFVLYGLPSSSDISQSKFQKYTEFISGKKSWEWYNPDFVLAFPQQSLSLLTVPAQLCCDTLPRRIWPGLYLLPNGAGEVAEGDSILI